MIKTSELLLILSITMIILFFTIVFYSNRDIKTNNQKTKIVIIAEDWARVVTGDVFIGTINNGKVISKKIN